MHGWPRPITRCRTVLLILCVLVAGLEPVTVVHAGEYRDSTDLAELELEDLANLQVSIVNKADEPLFDAAAAVFVLTADQIKQAGVSSIADALRLVPGFHVARMDAGKWAISARGFNSLYANKLLVLIDGRSVYNPHYSGVYWDMQNVDLADVDRIEVIRGPGASTWGANAVNGVVNVILKDASATQGGLATSGGGTAESVFGSLRYGAALGASAAYRIYLQGNRRASIGPAATGGHHDSWNTVQGGFRLDVERSDVDHFSIHGDVYDANATTRWVVPSLLTAEVEPQDKRAPFMGWNVLGHWDRTVSERSHLKLNAYVDRYERQDLSTQFFLTTFDVDYQQWYRTGSRWELSWGGGLRLYDDRMIDSEYSLFGISHQDRHVLSAFVQQSVDVLADRLKLTVGSKFEDHTYTGFNIQPSIRGSWRLNSVQAVWASVSRAVRTPGRNERSGSYAISVLPPSILGEDNQLSVLTELEANSRFGNEDLIAYELGWRAMMSHGVSTDLALYYNDYDELRTVEYGTPQPVGDPPVYIELPIYLVNRSAAHAYGFELSTTARLCPAWHINANYSYLRLIVENGDGPSSRIFYHEEDASPSHIANIQSHWMPAAWVDVGTVLRYQDAVRQGNLPAFTELDLRLAVRPFRSTELAIVGRDLIQPRHREADYGLQVVETEIERSVYTALSWSF